MLLLHWWSWKQPLAGSHWHAAWEPVLSIPNSPWSAKVSSGTSLCFCEQGENCQMHVLSYFILHIDFVCSFCQQCYFQGLLESLPLVMVVISKTPILKVCCALKIFLGISIDHWCFPVQLMSTCSFEWVMTWIGCGESTKILNENTALWLKSVFFLLKFFFFNYQCNATCQPQFIHNESDCFSDLIFRSFCKDFMDWTNRLYVNWFTGISSVWGWHVQLCNSS